MRISLAPAVANWRHRAIVAATHTPCESAAQPGGPAAALTNTGTPEARLKDDVAKRTEPTQGTTSAGDRNFHILAAAGKNDFLLVHTLGPAL